MKHDLLPFARGYDDVVVGENVAVLVSFAVLVPNRSQEITEHDFKSV